MTRRSAFAAFSAALLAPLAARAQGASVGPAGGVGSTTAPSNSQGTPAGGTGVIGVQRTVPTTTNDVPPARASAPLVGGAPGTAETAPTHSTHRRRHRARHRTTTTTPAPANQ